MKDDGKLKYIRLTEGLYDKGKLIPKDDDIEKYIKTTTKDYYASPYFYNQEHMKRFKSQGGSVAGIRDVVSDSLWWDFDDEENPENSRRDAIALCHRLIDLGVKADSINIAFSGNKGFEVSLQTTRTFTPSRVEELCSELADSLETFDRSVYDSNQIVRVTGTKHPSSGLYKTALTFDDLKDHTVNEIKEYTKERLPVPPKQVINLPKSFDSIKSEKQPVSKSKNTSSNDNVKPKWLCPSKWALQLGLYEKGEGNEARMILAATYKAQGFDESMTRSMILLAEERRAERIGTEVIDESELQRTVLDVVYGPFWTGGQYSLSNNALLQAIVERNGIEVEYTKEARNKVIRISDVAGDFKEFAKNIDKNRIFTGIKELDKRLIITTGMPWGLIGAPSSGKTSVAIDILRHNSQNNIPCVFASLDVTKRRLYEKLALNHLSRHYGREDLYEYYKQDSKLAKEIDAKIAEEFKNVYLFSQASPSVTELSKYISTVEDSTGTKVKFVCVDYFERLSVDLNDETAASKRLAGQLQDMVVKHDVSLLTLLQPNKMTGDPSSPITSYLSIKGSSFIQQSLRMILSVYREGFSPDNPDEDNFMTINCLKDDLGGLFSVDFAWDGRYGNLDTLDASGKAKLGWLRDNKKGDKDDTFS